MTNWGAETIRGIEYTFITSFISLDLSITAAGGTTIVASVRCIVVAVVTAFTRADDTIAADVGTTVGFAGILVHLVAVVAGFVSRVLST